MTLSQHLGGIHSGCALSGTGWLILKVVNNFRHHDVNPDLILVIGTITNVAVIVGALSAVPWIRNNHHKYVLQIASGLQRGLTYSLVFSSVIIGLLDGSLSSSLVKHKSFAAEV